MARDHGALAAYLAARSAMPFAFGRRANDCAAFAGGAVKAQTGRDPLAKLRWTTERGALRVIMRMGGLEAAVSSRLVPIAPAFAQRGDIAGVRDPHAMGGVRLMVVEGATLAGPGERGLERLPRGAMDLAWSAGG